MSTLTITYPARCKDCKFLKSVSGKYKNGNIKTTYICDGPGETKGQQRAKRDLVCKDWNL